MAGESRITDPAIKGWQAIQQSAPSQSTRGPAVQYGIPKGAQLKTQGSAGEGHMRIVYDTGNNKHNERNDTKAD